MKRLISFLLIIAIALSLVACDSISALFGEKDDGVLRVLLFGHSLGHDAMWMLPDVFANEAPDTKVEMGVLYYSGCPLAAHVIYSYEPAPVYSYIEFNSEQDTYWRVAESSGEFRPVTRSDGLDGSNPEYGYSQTSLFALQRQDWDIVVFQGYPWEVTKTPGYDANLIGNFNKLKQYVLDNDIDKDTTPKFAWNMVWGVPDDDYLIRGTDRTIMDTFFSSFDEYYTKAADIVKDELMPELKLDYVMPSSTAFINAMSGYKAPNEMFRDGIHATEFGRIMTSYVWYCTLTGANIADCKFEPVNYNYRLDKDAYKKQEDLALSAEDKQTIIEVVGNAISKPYEITPKA